RATLLAVIRDEHAALGPDAIDVWSHEPHQPATVGADVRLADVIAEDDEDVGFSLLCLSDSRSGNRNCHESRQQAARITVFQSGLTFHNSSGLIFALSGPETGSVRLRTLPGITSAGPLPLPPGGHELFDFLKSLQRILALQHRVVDPGGVQRTAGL